MNETDGHERIVDVMVDHPAGCDRCQKQIRGIRYRCSNCPDWDYCSGCYQNAQREHPMHQFIRHTEPKVIPRVDKSSSLSQSELGHPSITIDPDRMSIVEIIRRLGTVGLRNHPREHRMFEYTPLTDTNSFRLLALMPRQEDGIIRCKTVHVTFDQELEFDALSYAWGNQKELARVLIEGMDFPIAESLEQFLKRVQPENQPLYLWIDALCIDQIDDVEKSTQVQRMRDIYGKARRVIFWLGEAADDSHIVLEAIKKGSYDHSATSLVAKLFQRPCWSRVWCLQELTLAKQSPLVMCGDKIVDWKLFESFFDNAPVWLSDSSAVLGSADYLSYLRTKRTFTNYAGIRKTYHRGPVRLPLDLLLLSLGTLKATDPRDYVYGCVGLSTDADAFRIDYTESLGQVFARTAQFVIESTRRLDILCHLTGLRNSKIVPSLPTWVPNWTDREAPPAIRGHSLYKASGDYIASVIFEGEKLKTAGTIFDRVERVSDPIIFTNGLENATDIIIELEKMMKAHISSHLAENSKNDADFLLIANTHPRITDKFWRTLICDLTFQIEDTSQRIARNAPENFGHLYEILRYGENPKDQPVTVDQSRQLLNFPQGLPKDFHSELPEAERMKKYISPFERTLMLLSNRCFFVTVRGDIGVAQRGVKQGDQLSVLLGSDIPFIIRPRGGNEPFQLVGEAYVHGAMRGQRLAEAEKTGTVYRISIQ